MRHPARLLVLMTALVLLLSTCGSETDGSTTPPDELTTSVSSTSSTQPLTTTTTSTPATTTTMPATTTTTTHTDTGFAVYFLLDELEEDAGGPFLVPVYRASASSGNLAQNAVELLLEGPTDGERNGIPTISTAIPDGTEALDTLVEGGVATVNLTGEFDDGGGSSGMFARLAQVVYTLTRIEGVDAVQFEIDGEPVSVFSGEGIVLEGPQERSGYYDLLPAIFVDSPAWGEPVSSAIRVSGLSNVFESVSQVMLTDDDGAPLFEDRVVATCGTGCWGEWEIEIAYTVDRDQFGALIVWEASARDGSRIHIREYPVQLR